MYGIGGTETSRCHRSVTKSRKPRPNESRSLVYYPRHHVY